VPVSEFPVSEFPVSEFPVAEFLAHHLYQNRATSLERDLYLLSIARPEELPSSLELPSPHHTALLAWHSDGHTVEEVGRVASLLVEDGCVHFGFWGGGADRAHDITDEVILTGPVGGLCMRDEDAPLIPTCGSEDDELDEALFMHLCCSRPDDAYEATTLASVVVLIGADEETGARVRWALRDPGRFIDEVCTQEEGEV